MNPIEQQNQINTRAKNPFWIAWAVISEGCALAWFVVRWPWLEWLEFRGQMLWENKMMLERCWEKEEASR
jgi:hypothetical protein